MFFLSLRSSLMRSKNLTLWYRTAFFRSASLATFSSCTPCKRARRSSRLCRLRFSFLGSTFSRRRFRSRISLATLLRGRGPPGPRPGPPLPPPRPGPSPGPPLPPPLPGPSPGPPLPPPLPRPARMEGVTRSTQGAGGGSDPSLPRGVRGRRRADWGCGEPTWGSAAPAPASSAPTPPTPAPSALSVCHSSQWGRQRRIVGTDAARVAGEAKPVNQPRLCPQITESTRCGVQTEQVTTRDDVKVCINTFLAPPWPHSPGDGVSLVDAVVRPGASPPSPPGGSGAFGHPLS